LKYLSRKKVIPPRANTFIATPETIWFPFKDIDIYPWRSPAKTPIIIARSIPIQGFPARGSLLPRIGSIFVDEIYEPKTAKNPPILIIPSRAMLTTPAFSHITPPNPARIIGVANWSIEERKDIIILIISISGLLGFSCSFFAN